MQPSTHNKTGHNRADPQPNSSRNLSKKYLKKKNRWLVTQDKWRVTCDTGHVTCDMWHITGGEDCVQKSIDLTVWELWWFYDVEEKYNWLNELIVKLIND